MKNFIPFAICLLLFCKLLNAQDSLPEKLVVFRATIKTHDKQINTGYLYAITGSSVFLSPGKQSLRFYGANDQAASFYDYNIIESLGIHRKGAVGRSVLAGTLTGVLIGAIIGLASGDDSNQQLIHFSAADKAAAGGLVLGAAGGITGLIIGLTAHKTFIIHGKKENFEKMRYKMMNKASL